MSALFRKPRRHTFPAKDIRGEVYGKLTALVRVGSSQHGVHWLCRCACGELTIAACKALEQAQRKSCGCGMGATRQHRVTPIGLFLGAGGRCDPMDAMAIASALGLSEAEVANSLARERDSGFSCEEAA